MCSFSVRNDKIRYEQISVFFTVFWDETYIQILSNTFIWLLMSFYRHKNIISRCVHTMIAHHTVIKTQILQNWTKMSVKYIYIYIFKPVLNVCYFNYMLLRQIHTNCFNISVICHELIFLQNTEVTVFWHYVVISSQRVSYNTVN